jgi:serine/threonine protein kinase
MNDFATLEAIFTDALETTPAERLSFVQEACGGDARLQRKLEKMLAAHAEAGSFLEAPPSAIAFHDRDATEPPAALERPGTRIGNYKLLQQIGEGGFGIVYMAEQERPVRRKVALKILKAGMDTKEIIARFESERQALALMDHPNIAKVLDGGAIPLGISDCGLRIDESQAASNPQSEIRIPQSSGRPYFVMELVRGQPITEFCDDNRLPLEDRLKLFIQVCQAVQHAHQKGIIHRDIKPTNVMVTLHGHRPVPKVIDFGIAKAMSQQLTERTLFTAYGQMVGTPAYMSPEQAAISGLDIDTRSDVYSLGVLLYELLTGTTPFEKERLKSVSFDEMRRIIREEEPETISARLAKTRKAGTRRSGIGTGGGNTEQHSRASRPPPLVPRRSELDWIVAKSLEKDRERRYESASTMARDVERYLNDEPVQACPPSAAYRLHKFARKNRSVLVTAIVVAASLLVGTTVSTWQTIRASAAEAQANANALKASGEEQKARAAAAAETLQREQAEKSLESAFEAVERMLANVGDDEFNDLPRIGPLRRKLLNDARGFIERIPMSDRTSPQTRFRLASTWARVAKLHFDLDELPQAERSYGSAVALLTRLVQEFPDDVSFKNALGDTYQQAGWFYHHGPASQTDAERSFQRSNELYAELARKEPRKEAWVIRQSRALCGLTAALTSQNRRPEAIIQGNRALELASSAKKLVHADRGEILYRLANLHIHDAPDQSDDLYRRSIQEHRAHLKQYPNRSSQVHLASMLDDAAAMLVFRHPDEARKLWDESITIWREICGATPRLRNDSLLFIRALTNNMRFLRGPAANSRPYQDLAATAARFSKAETLFQEALTHRRNNVYRFQLAVDRFHLAELLAEETRFVSDDKSQPASGSDSQKHLKADALVTEAIQLCRTLAAEFPDDVSYKTRLGELMTLQATNRVDRLLRDGKSEQALAEVTAAIAASPTISDYYAKRASIYRGLGDLERAVADYTEALRRSPDDVGRFQARGDLYIVLKQYDLALHDYTKVSAQHRQGQGFQTRRASSKRRRARRVALASAR